MMVAANHLLSLINDVLQMSKLEDGKVELTLEEYETLRLLDGERLNQVECALRMEVSRPTVQILYARARRKIARFLAEGGELRISGGDYRVCENCGPHCNCGCKCGKSNNDDTSDQ